MKVTYTPEGATPRVWDFRPGRLLNAEAEAIEDKTGWTYQEFGVAFMSGSMKAYHALLWVMLRRTTHNLKWDEVVFAYDEIEVEFDAEEKQRMVEEMERNLDDLDDQQMLFLAQLKLELQKDPDDEGKADSGSATADAATSG